MKLSIPPNFFSDGCLANSPDSLIVDGWIGLNAKLMNARGHVVDADAFRAFGRRAFYAARCFDARRSIPARRRVRPRFGRVASACAPRRFDDSTIRGFDANAPSDRDRIVF
jgi:hypothetical protein